MIDLGRALKYPFSGPNAVSKNLMGGVLAVFAPLLIPVLLLLGYQLRIIRDVLSGRDNELPDWDDPGGDILSGVLVFLGTLVYYLPAFILTGIGAALTLTAIEGFNLARIIFEGAALELDRGQLALALLAFTGALVWMALTAPVVMTGVARFAETSDFRTLIDLPEAFRTAWQNRGSAAMLMLYLFLVAVMAHLIAAAAASACLLPAYVQFVHFTVVAHLNGQWAALIKAQRPRPSVIRPIAPPPGRA